MNSWFRSALRVGMFAAGAADAPLASENDKLAAPNAGKALLLRFRLDGCFARDMADTSYTSDNVQTNRSPQQSVGTVIGSIGRRTW
jgi:hypothetical protein